MGARPDGSSPFLTWLLANVAALLLFGLGLACALGLLVATFMALHGGEDGTWARLLRTRDQGDVLVTALEDWRVARGRYPHALGELVPESLPEVPTPAVEDQDWTYVPKERGSGYWLAVNAVSPSMEYRVKAWSCETHRAVAEPVLAGIEAWRDAYGGAPRALRSIGHDVADSWREAGGEYESLTGGGYWVRIRGHCSAGRGWKD